LIYFAFIACRKVSVVRKVLHPAYCARTGVRHIVVASGRRAYQCIDVVDAKDSTAQCIVHISELRCKSSLGLERDTCQSGAYKSFNKSLGWRGGLWRSMFGERGRDLGWKDMAGRVRMPRVETWPEIGFESPASKCYTGNQTCLRSIETTWLYSLTEGGYGWGSGCRVVDF